MSDAVERKILSMLGLSPALLAGGKASFTATGEEEFQPYSADGERGINSISRGELNAVLLDSAQKLPGVSLHFEHRLTAHRPHVAHRVGRDDHPHQQEAELRAGADVGRDVARVDVGDSRDEGGPEQGPACRAGGTGLLVQRPLQTPSRPVPNPPYMMGNGSVSAALGVVVIWVCPGF